MKSTFEKRKFKSDVLRLDVAEHLAKLATLPASIRVVYDTLCEKNGASFYYSLHMEGCLNSVTLRLSDHANGLGYGIHKGPLGSISINAGLHLSDDVINEILYAFGLVTRSLEVIEWEDTTIETMTVKPGQEVVSQRVTKNGNTLYSIKFKRPKKSQHIYKTV